MHASSNPAVLGLRLNFRNLANEMKLYKGQTISSQLILRCPRPKARHHRLQKLDVDIPDHCDKALFRKVQRRRAKEQKMQAAKARDINCLAAFPTLSNAKIRSMSQITLDHMTEEEYQAMIARDPTTKEEIRQMITNEQIRVAYSSFEDLNNGGMGLPEGRIVRALESIGYKKPDVDVIKERLKLLVFREKGNPLTIDEFCVVAAGLQEKRSGRLWEIFRSLDTDYSGHISIQEFHSLLWTMGFTVSFDTLDDIFNEVDTDKSGFVEFEEFEAAEALVQERHGFTKREVRDIYELFNRFDRAKSGQMSFGDLASALTFLGQPTSPEQGRVIIRRFDTDGKGTLCKAEFLAAMRARIEDEISELRSLFADADEEKSGHLQVHELCNIFMRIGYTVEPMVVQAAIVELFPTCVIGQGLVFQEALRVLTEVRKQEGFSKQEYLELIDTFAKFETRGQGELREFELARAMTWLGQPHSHQRRKQLWLKVDVDRSGYIDPGEFLKLMRLVREEETGHIRAMLKHIKTEDGFRGSDLKDILFKMGYAPAHHVFEEAMALFKGNSDVLAILSILKYVREKGAEQSRQTARLDDKKAAKVRAKFAARIEAGQRIEVPEFEKFMNEMVKIRYPGEVTLLKNTIEQYAVEGSLGLTEMFWALRTWDDHLELEVLAAEIAGFSPEEVLVYLHLFVEADVHQRGRLQFDQVMSAMDVFFHDDAYEGNKLEREIRDLGAEQDSVHFAEFLRLANTVGSHTKDNHDKSAH